MQRQKITVEKRKVLGKKVKNLRKEGLMPASIYGKGVKSLSVQVKTSDFEKVYQEAGETGLIDVLINSETRPSLIHNVQTNPITNQYLHADFFQVNLKEKIKAMVPVVTKGEAKAVTDKAGLLLTPLSEIEVEALPQDLPEKIEVDVTKLANVSDQVTVSDIKAPAGTTILTSPTQIIVKIGELVSKEAQEQAAAEQAAAEAAKATTAATAATGAAIPQGEQAETVKPSEAKTGEAPKTTPETAKQEGKPQQ